MKFRYQYGSYGPHQQTPQTEPAFYGDLVYKFKRIVGDQFKNIYMNLIPFLYVGIY